MKIGDRIGVGYGKDRGIDLYCEIVGFDGTDIRMYVINGHWTLLLQPGNKGLVVEKDHVIDDVYITYTGYLPPAAEMNYNQAIEFMRMAQKDWKLRTWVAITVPVMIWFERLGRGWTAFKKAYYGRDANDPSFDFDDTIPF